MRRIAGLLVVATLALGQDYGQDDNYQDGYGEESYQDYANQQDNLYADYATKQQQKAEGGGGGGGGLPKLLGCGLAGWVLGAKFHTGRATKKLKAQHKAEQKKLYTQYYNDVYKLQEANAELQYTADYLKQQLEQAVVQSEQEKMQRDYDEFKQPDVDGDDRISRAEFNMYVKNYLSNYPGLTEADYPRFEDFDHDGDGFINFQEYSSQMALQAKQAEKEQVRAAQSGASPKAQEKAHYKTQAIKGLAGETSRAGDFDDLYATYKR